ncbi:MAG TPA: tRNA pseudouridine(38-40) synthase TruA [Candidatus Saccharimonadales bacterium]|nr:tRNA pseudouridine(38-40) synthase TruA [Candidatus Saccharimonadales bacterium]
MEAIKVKFVVAYDGTAYAGWQVQKIGLGVQQKVEEAFQKLFPSVTRIHGSSRTDTGVHALGMVAHVEIPVKEFRMDMRKLPLALNANLPGDIRIMSAVRCHPDFHARFDASGKQYRYFVWNQPCMNPLLRFQAWHVPLGLELAVMQRSAPHLIGKHDFKSFAASRNYEMETTVRKLTRCDIHKKGPLITFIIEGDGFLYKMCRGIVGTLVQIGRGKFTPNDLKAMLEARDRREAGMSAPAHGLVLWKVFYNGPKRRQRSKLLIEHAHRPG